MTSIHRSTRRDRRGGWPALAGLVLLVLGLAGSASAQERWYEAYEDGVRAFQAGDLATAEQKLAAALKANPKQGRSVRMYGTRFIDYFPEYYLALIQARRGNAKLALEGLQRVEAAGLIRRGQREFAELERVRAQLQQNASAAPVSPSGTQTTPVQPSTGGQPSQTSTPTQTVQTVAPPSPTGQGPTGQGPTGQGTTGQAKAAQGTVGQGTSPVATTAANTTTTPVPVVPPTGPSMDQLLDQATRAVRARRFPEAQAALQAARQRNAADPRIAPLLEGLIVEQEFAQIETAVAASRWQDAQRRANAMSASVRATPRFQTLWRRIEAGLPAPPPPPTPTPALAPANAVASRERDALRAFLIGEYDRSAGLLEEVVTAAPNSARAWYLLAFSYAAQDVVRGDAAAGAKARDSYVRAKQLQPAAIPAGKYVSPKILELLERSGSSPSS